MATILRDASVSSDASTPSWIRTPYGVKLSENPANSFKTLLEVEKFVMAHDGSEPDIAANVYDWMAVISDVNVGPGNMNKDGLADGNAFYSKPNYTDTRVGGNDAINPYWQFNRDDDIVPPMLCMKLLRGSDADGMGRVYNEVYDSNQQILWLSMGVPEYCNLISFYRDAGNMNAAKAMNKGTLRGLAGKLIKLVFSATIWAITFPITAPFWINRWISRIETDRISKYFYFKPAMVLYYEMCNTMLSYLAVSMGLYPQVLTRRRDSSKELHAQFAQLQGEPDPVQSTMQISNNTKYLQNPFEDVTQFGNAEEIRQSQSAARRRQLRQAAEQASLSEAEVYEQQRSAASIRARAQSSGGNDMVAQNDRAAGTMSTGPVKDTGVNGNAQVQTMDMEHTQALRDKPIKDSGIPELLQEGPDIFTILNRRARLFNAMRYKLTTRMLMDEMMYEDQNIGSNHFTSPDTKYVSDKDGNVTAAADGEKADETGAWAKTWSSLKANMFGAGDYVGFRIERDASCSESVSNSTGPTGVAQKMNSYAQQQKEKYENYGNSWAAKTLGSLAQGPQEGLKEVAADLVGQLGSAFGLGDIGAILTQGNGFLDMPEVWKGSSFSRSYSFTIQLRARYGDPVSIYQSVYIPLIMLLAAAMPRSIGDSMYTSPFLIKAYSKGMFAIPCGIIESMSIQRGKDEFGWSNVHLPTSVDVSLSIKDLSPTFFLSMSDIGLFDTFSRNDNFIEYLDTLSALGITERIYMWPKVMRKLTAALLIKRNTIFNSNYWGMRIGRNNLVRAIAAVTPFGNMEKSDFEYNASTPVFNTSTPRFNPNRGAGDKDSVLSQLRQYNSDVSRSREERRTSGIFETLFG